MKKGALLQALADAQKEADEDEDEDDDSIMDADVTPLMLAAQRNQFEVMMTSELSNYHISVVSLK